MEKSNNKKEIIQDIQIVDDYKIIKVLNEKDTCGGACCAGDGTNICGVWAG